MSLEEIKSLMFKLDYPSEKYPDVLKAFNFIKESKGVDFIDTGTYAYLSKFKKCKRLGVFTIDRDSLAIANSMAGRFTMLQHVKSRRCDYISAYDYWQKNKSEVIELAVQQLHKYKDDYSPDELPLELNGSGSQIALEHECAMALVRIGMPASFPANLMVFMIGDIEKLSILDISAGWGDRLIAACSMNARYVGCDPNTALTPAYDKIIKEYGNGTQVIHSIPFEDFNYIGEKFNCLYSSPPFYDLEIYSTEQTQSSERYKSLEMWLNDFLKVCLAKADNYLLKGAYIYLHLNDIDVKARYENGVKVTEDRVLNYVEHIIKYVSENFKWRFVGNFGFAIKSGEDKESETSETRIEKNKKLLVPTRYVKTYKNGIRCNGKGEMLTQPIWFFIKECVNLKV